MRSIHKLKKLKPSFLHSQGTPMRDETRSVSWAFQRSPPVPVERLVRTSGLSHGPVLCNPKPCDLGCKRWYKWMWLMWYSSDSLKLTHLFDSSFFYFIYIILFYKIDRNWMQSASCSKSCHVASLWPVSGFAASWQNIGNMVHSVGGSAHTCMFKECLCQILSQYLRQRLRSVQNWNGGGVAGQWDCIQSHS